MATHDAEAASANPDNDEPMVQLSKYILLLATLVATVTYAAGFNPPGGVWQDAAAGRLAGDPIIRYTNKTRYLVFFYSNATAFASSLVVIVLVLFLALLYEKRNSAVPSTAQKNLPLSVVVPLRGVMVLDLLSLMGAYAAATCRDTLTTINSSVLVAAVFIYLVIQMVWASLQEDGVLKKRLREVLMLPVTSPLSTMCKERLRKVLVWASLREHEASSPQAEAPDDAVLKKRLRKVLMLLATFAVSVTYVAGMSTPGGFWDNNAEGGHRPGDAILKDRHGARLTVFLCCNTMAFVASLLIIVVLLDRNYRVKQAYMWITVALISLIGAYTAGSCREIDTTVYVVSLVGAVLVFIIFLQAVVLWRKRKFIIFLQAVGLWRKSEHHGVVAGNVHIPVSDPRVALAGNVHSPLSDPRVAVAGHGHASVRRWLQGPVTNKDRKEAEKARSLVLLLATLAATITYQAGLDPPGGVWSDNGNGHMAGDPILLTTNPRRYNAFFYCNSVAFVASLVAIILVQKKLMLRTHVLEAAMILDLFGLIGAYAAGSCRDVSTSIYAMALAGAVLVYVVIHVVFFTLDHTDTDTDNTEINDRVEKRRKRLLLFAVLAATMTYQTGLTPPGGFRLQDDWSSGRHAGDPVLLHNFHRRYTAFFYCNSVSFMLSIALIILLVNPHLYRPAIRSYALAVCTAAGMFGLMGAYAAGSTQYLKTSIYIFVLVGVVLFVIAVLVLVFLVKEMNKKTSDNAPAQSPSASGEPEATRTVNDEEKKQAELKKKTVHAKRKYLMLLGILVASVTYQAGLDPPGGAWQQSSGWHDAGNPVLHDSNRPRYLAFFYSNSISFVASIVIIILLVVQWMKKGKFSLRVMNAAIVLDLLALLVAYAAGSSRGWKTSMYAVALVIAVLAYVAIHIVLAFLCACMRSRQSRANAATTPSP